MTHDSFVKLCECMQILKMEQISVISIDLFITIREINEANDNENKN